jgi:hypothetical protein
MAIPTSSDPGIRREVGSIALLFTALGSIIGSGWLFGAWRAAQLAGPGAVYAWLLGAVIILFVALTFAELGAMFPESGGAVRYGLYSHGSLVGFVAGWASWISIVSVIPVEAEASVQYMSSWSWGWAQELYHHAAHGGGELTTPGLHDRRCSRDRLFSVEFLEREGIREHEQRDHVLQVDRTGGDRDRIDGPGVSLGELPYRQPRRPVRHRFRRDPDRGCDQRHRVQLQRFPKPGQPRR